MKYPCMHYINTCLKYYNYFSGALCQQGSEDQTQGGPCRACRGDSISSDTNHCPPSPHCCCGFSSFSRWSDTHADQGPCLPRGNSGGSPQDPGRSAASPDDRQCCVSVSFFFNTTIYNLFKIPNLLLTIHYVLYIRM